MRRKILQISHQTDITLFTHHTLPLLIPFINDHTAGWYMNNFINIFYRHEHPSFFDYCDYKRFYQDVLDTDRLTYSTALLINEPQWFIKLINEDKYIYAWVDQFYISSSIYYNKRHDIHPVLIYGYDMDLNVYFCKCFSMYTSVYNATVPVNEYHLALTEAARSTDHINDDTVFCVYKIPANKFYDFSLDNFYNELINYYYGTGSNYSGAYFSNSNWLFQPADYAHSSYGIEVTKLFAKGFEEELRHFDYRLFHMIWENKHCIYKRLCYVFQLHSNDIKSRDLITRYKQLLTEWDKLRMSIMKKAISINHRLNNLSFPSEIANKFKLRTLDLYEKEKLILNDILHVLTDLCVLNYFSYKKLHELKLDLVNLIHESVEYPNTEGIVLFNPLKRFKGSLIINDNVYEIDEVRTQNFFYFPCSQDIKKCSFVPSDCCSHSNFLRVYLAYSLPSPSCYSTSSTYPSEHVFISPDNLGLHNDLFWCSNTNDTTPYIDLIFPYPIRINTILLVQHYMERRVGGIQLEAFIDNVWKVIYSLDNITLNQQVICKKFGPVIADKYRIIITKKYMSENGFDIPNIMYLKVYDADTL